MLLHSTLLLLLLLLLLLALRLLTLYFLRVYFHHQKSLKIGLKVILYVIGYCPSCVEHK